MGNCRSDPSIGDNLTPGNPLCFRRDGIKCRYSSCSSSFRLINFDYNCSSCGQVVPTDAELTAPSPGAISGPIIYSSSGRYSPAILIVTGPFFPPFLSTAVLAQPTSVPTMTTESCWWKRWRGWSRQCLERRSETTSHGVHHEFIKISSNLLYT